MRMLKEAHAWKAMVPTAYLDSARQTQKKKLPFLLVQFRSHGVTDLNQGKAWYCLLYNEHDSVYLSAYPQLAAYYQNVGTVPFKIKKNLELAHSFLQQQLALYPAMPYTRVYDWRVRAELDSGEATRESIINEVNTMYEKYKDSLAPGYEFFALVEMGRRAAEADSLQARTVRKAPNGYVAQVIESVKKHPNTVIAYGPPTLTPTSCRAGSESDSSAQLRALIDKGN